MNLELEATKNNNIWELADLPNRGNKIRVNGCIKQSVMRMGK
jgi:hypothetical protein